MSRMTVAARRYAKALFEVAKAKGAVEETQVQLSAIAETLQNDLEIQAFFNHPNINSDAKINALKSAVGSLVSGEVIKTIQLLLERGRAAAIPEVLSMYSEIADATLGRAHAQVTSAYEMTPGQQQEIADKFSALTGKTVTVGTVVDPSLLGGIRVRIGDTLYDGSLATKLADLEKSFNNAR